jgi:hypothetical protein
MMRVMSNTGIVARGALSCGADEMPDDFASIPSAGSLSCAVPSIALSLLPFH